MNVEEYIVLENWEKLFSEIRKGGNRWLSVKLSDSKADQYDFANEILMPRMRERLVEALQRLTQIDPTGSLTAFTFSFGNKFFRTLNEQQQQSFFHSIFNLPVWRITVGEDETVDTTESPAITISTPALLETLPHLHESVMFLNVSNFALTRQSDVQELSNIILSRHETLESLELKSIKCPVDGCNKEGRDESDGFLDPLFYAASGIGCFSISSKTRSVHSTLVSPRALRAQIVQWKFHRKLRLNGLGLTESHVLAIVDVFPTPDTHFSLLNLESNPDITAQGYDALFNLINGGLRRSMMRFCVDDKAWEAKLNLVFEMNSAYCRLEYLMNGTFTSEERKCQWLEELADHIRRQEFYDRGTRDCKKNKKKRDAKHLNFIWYTLCQNPEIMQVSQAPTWTTKRKATRSTSPLSGTHSAKTQK
jgi:hypothetical protein